MARPVYRVVARDLGTSFAPGDVIADFMPTNLGYAEYVNTVGEAFVTVSQSDPKIAEIAAKVEDGIHLEIWRGTDQMFGGWLGETDETAEDVVLYAYNYASGLFELHTDWAQEWTDKKIGVVVQDLWDRAQAAVDSRMAWMSDGFIQNPVTTSGGAIDYILPLYKTYYKRLLFAVQELAAAAISDTTNRVVWEITPAGVFNFWKNRGTDLTDILWQYPSPKVMGFRRLRTPTDRRNVLFGVGTNARDVALRTTSQNPADRAAKGRREEAIYLQWVRDQDELERVTNFRKWRALRVDQQLFLTFAPWSITPFRATGQDYKLTDGVPVKIQHGATNIDTTMLVLGQQVVFHKGHEIVRPLLGSNL